MRGAKKVRKRGKREEKEEKGRKNGEGTKNSGMVDKKREMVFFFVKLFKSDLGKRLSRSMEQYTPLDLLLGHILTWKK